MVIGAFSAKANSPHEPHPIREDPMANFRFIHAADLHLDSPLTGLEKYEGAPVDEIRLATRAALENLVQLAIEREVDFVLIAGDIYDGDWKDHNTGLFFAKQMIRLKNEGIPVFGISGNHDATNKMTRSVKLPENVHWFSHRRAETKKLDDLGVAIHGRSFANQAEMNNLAREYPDQVRGMFNIGLLHTSLEGSSEHATYAPCSLDDLRSRGYDYWALGHIHTRQVVSEDPFVVFPGNPQGRHIREPDRKGVYLVSVDERGNAELEFCPTDVMQWKICTIAVDGVKQYETDLHGCISDALSSLVEESDGDLMAVRLLIEGRTELSNRLHSQHEQLTGEVRSIALDVGSGNLWIEKIKVLTRPEADRASIEMEGPLAEIEATCKAIASDNDELKRLESELEPLKKKLPSELLKGADALKLDDSAWLREMLEQAQSLVMDQLNEEAVG